MNAAEPSDSKLTNSSNFYVLVFGLIMLVGLVALAWIGRPPKMVLAGETLPNLDLQPLVHAESSITKDDLDDKVAVLHFWGTWCPPCQIEFPEFAELAAEFEDNQDVMIVSVSCSRGAEFDTEALRLETEEFLTQFPNRIPTYCDSTAITRQNISMLSSTGSFGYPTTILVGRDGKIISSIDGYRPGAMESLVGTIKSAL